jgi:hypothetical protein
MKERNNLSLEGKQHATICHLCSKLTGGIIHKTKHKSECTNKYVCFECMVTRERLA